MLALFVLLSSGCSLQNGQVSSTTSSSIDTEKEKLDARFQRLRSLTCSGPAARKNRPQAAVTYFVPCGDKNSFAYGFEGTYNTVKGTVEKADQYEIVIDGCHIPLDDVADVC